MDRLLVCVLAQFELDTKFPEKRRGKSHCISDIHAQSLDDFLNLHTHGFMPNSHKKS